MVGGDNVNEGGGPPARRPPLLGVPHLFGSSELHEQRAAARGKDMPGFCAHVWRAPTGSRARQGGFSRPILWHALRRLLSSWAAWRGLKPVGVSIVLTSSWECVRRYRDVLEVPLILPMGGNIDILSGRTRTIPTWIKKSGVTWLYRMIQEPRRLGRAMGRNALDVTCRLLPRLFWEHKVRRAADFSIAEYYKGRSRRPR